MIQLIQNIILLTLALAVILNCLPVKKFGKYALWAGYLAVFFVAIDILSGNFRWQMIIAYFLALLMLVLPRFRKSNNSNTKWWRKLLFSGYVMISILILTVSIILPSAFVMFELPAPSGKYDVGVKDIHLVDKDRKETLTEDENDVRELMVRAWYPAIIDNNSNPEPFVKDIEPVYEIFKRSLPIPKFILSHLKKIPSHSYLDALELETTEKFPVLVFNHGLSFYASQNKLLMEELASNGYVVLSINHTYDASWVKFPKGEVKTFKSEGQFKAPTQEEIDEWEVKAKSKAETMLNGTYEEYYSKTKDDIETNLDINSKVQVWTDDISFVLDQLQNGERQLIEMSRMADLNKIGVFGMSLGGAAAGKFCLEDPRCKAVLNMDGTQFGQGAINYQFEKPFMMLNGDRRLDYSRALGTEFVQGPLPKYEMNDFLLHQSKNITYNLVVDKSVHGSFSDFLLMTMDFGSWTGLLGKVDPWAMKGILDDYSLAFFNKHLKKIEEPLLDGPSKYHPEVVKFEVRN